MKVVQIAGDLSAANGVGTFVRNLVRALEREGVGSTLAPRADGVLDGADLVHIHGLWRPDYHLAAVAARRRGLPVVWSTHGMTAPWAMAHRRWKKLPAWLVYQRGDLRRATALHATSDAEAEWNRALGLGESAVVPLGTEVGSVTPVAPSDTARTLRVTFVGRLHPIKGLDRLLRAAKLVGDRAEFRLVGPDEDGYRAKLEREAARLGLRNVVFAGPAYGEDLAAAYDDCDVLVLPSHTENFGAVVVDALAHARPVIAARGTPWRTLEEHGCGWWTDNEPAALAAVVVAAAELPRSELYARGLVGRRLVEERYSWEAVARGMAAVYRRALG